MLLLEFHYFRFQVFGDDIDVLRVPMGDEGDQLQQRVVESLLVFVDQVLKFLDQLWRLARQLDHLVDQTLFQVRQGN